jgi:hypothetical protein
LKLPKRKGGAIRAIKFQSKPGDALIAAHEDLEGATKTAVMQTLAKAAQEVAGKEALDVSNTAQLRDVCLAAARIFGWDGKPQTEVNITNQVGVICDEATRMRLIALREKITLAERGFDISKVAMSSGPLGTVAGVQLAAVFQSPLAGLRFQVALPAWAGTFGISTSNPHKSRADSG